MIQTLGSHSDSNSDKDKPAFCSGGPVCGEQVKVKDGDRGVKCNKCGL